MNNKVSSTEKSTVYYRIVCKFFVALPHSLWRPAHLECLRHFPYKEEHQQSIKKERRKKNYSKFIVLLSIRSNICQCTFDRIDVPFDCSFFHQYGHNIFIRMHIFRCCSIVKVAAHNWIEMLNCDTLNLIIITIVIILQQIQLKSNAKAIYSHKKSIMTPGKMLADFTILYWIVACRVALQ